MVLDHRFQLLTHLGSGGMGAVYLAEHVTLGRKFAIKILKQELCARREFVERFQREARAATAIDHPHVIDVVDTGFFPDGTAYYVMEHLQGEDLACTLRNSGRLAWPRVRHIALQICDALSSAHGKGIIHRDLKPENCFRVTRKADQDFIKILDFGIAKLLGPPGASLTDTGQLLGTPYYMAPEQAMGQKVDHRVDIYSLGAMLYQLLTGQVPFEGRSGLEVLSALLTRTPMPIHLLAPDAGIPPELEDIVERAMQREPAWRFPSMAAFSEALARIETSGSGAAVHAPASSTPPTVHSADAQNEALVPFALTAVARAPALPEHDRGPDSTDLGLTVIHTPAAPSLHPPLESLAPTRPRAKGLGTVGLGIAALVGVVGVVAIAMMLVSSATPTSTAPHPEAAPATAARVEPDAPLRAVTSPPADPPADPETTSSVSLANASAISSLSSEPPLDERKQPRSKAQPPTKIPSPTKVPPPPLLRPKPASTPKSHQDVKAVLDQVAKDIRASCHSNFGDRVGVSVTVEAATGRLRTRKVLAPHEESMPVWKCIADILDRAEFPGFVGGDYVKTIEFEIPAENE